MDGVTILTTHVYRTCELWEVIFSSVLIFLMLGLFWLLSWILVGADTNHSTLIGIILAIVFLAAFLGIEFVIWNDYMTIYTDHIVTIDDTVNFNEFSERYEVISQDGALYTIRERE
jgi:hypothetical protein